MLEKLYDHTPEDVEETLNAYAIGLINDGVVPEEDDAIKAAFCLLAMDLSNGPLTEDELQEACEKLQLYMADEGTDN